MAPGAMATPTWRRRVGSTISPLPTATSSSVLAATAQATGLENWRVVRSLSRALSASASAHPLETVGHRPRRRTADVRMNATLGLELVASMRNGPVSPARAESSVCRSRVTGPSIRDHNGQVGRCGDDPPADPRTEEPSVDWRTVLALAAGYGAPGVRAAGALRAAAGVDRPRLRRNRVGELAVT
jgi:hypothetical protein